MAELRLPWPWHIQMLVWVRRKQIDWLLTLLYISGLLCRDGGKSLPEPLSQHLWHAGSTVHHRATKTNRQAESPWKVGTPTPTPHCYPDEAQEREVICYDTKQKPFCFLWSTITFPTLTIFPKPLQLFSPSLILYIFLAVEHTHPFALPMLEIQCFHLRPM